MPITSLLAALITYCRPSLPEGTTILHPGDALTSAPSLAWAEFWIDRVTTPVARRSAPQVLDISLTINCFGRPPISASATANLAESIGQHLTSATIPIDPDNPSLGLIRVTEPERRDLSRPATAKTAGLWHWIITVKGQVTSPP